MSQSIRGGLKHRGERQFSGPVFSDSLANKTSGPIAMEVDYTLGTSPPAGTVATSQDDYDTLVAGFSNPYLKYPQDALEILPSVLGGAITVTLKAGTHYAKPSAYGGPFGLSAALWLYDKVFDVTAVGDFSLDNGTYRTHSMEFIGELAAEESAQAGTLAASTATRAAGTWVADEHKGRFVTVMSGASAGQRLPIASNTTTELQVAGTFWATGACTFEITELASTLLGSTNGTDDVSGLILEGPNQAMTLLSFRNLAFGTAAKRMDGVGSRHIGFDLFNTCRAYLTSDGGDALFYTNSLLIALNSYWDIDTPYPAVASDYAIMNFGACAMVVKTTNGTGALQATSTGQLYFSENSIITVPSGYAKSILHADSGKINISGVTLDGDGTAKGIVVDGMGQLDIPGTATVNNCTVGVSVANSTTLAVRAAVSGSGNTKAWEVTKASRLVVNSPASLAGTTEVDVDGTTYTYSADLPSVGSEIVGSLKSSMVRI